MKSFIIGLILLGFVGTGFAVEQLDLTTPITISSYRVVRLVIDKNNQEVTVCLHNAIAEKDVCFSYGGAQALALMVQMNKMNFSTNSMEKVILNKLVNDGKIVGTISGTPD